MSAKEFVRYLAIAKGSLGELKTQMVISERIGYLSNEQAQSVFEKIDETGRMINGLIRSISKAVNPYQPL